MPSRWDAWRSRTRLFLLVTASACAWSTSAASLNLERAGHYDLLGQARFADCDFKHAVGAFEMALKWQPGDATLHHWLGKSYARLAEVSSILRAPSHARKARRNLERAVELQPANQEFLRDLFQFYLDSPEWFGGGTGRAALLLERLTPADSMEQAFLEARLKEARQDAQGAGWWMRMAVLWPSQKASHLVP